MLRKGRYSAHAFPVSRQIAVSVLWFAWYAQWTAFPAIVQRQVPGIVGAGAPWLDFAVGLVIAAGATMALIIAPLAGALSDRFPASAGRRRPFLILSMIAGSAALLIFPAFERGGSLLLYVLAYVHLQFWWNLGTGPYTGMIPDVVPHQYQGPASGWRNVLIILGTIIGSLVLWKFTRGVASIMAIFIALNLLCLLATLVWVREPPRPPTLRRRTLGAFLRSFWLPPAENRDFYLVLATRLFSNLGIWSILAFLVLYLEGTFSLHATDAQALMGLLLFAGAVVAVPASLFGIRMTHRFGLVFTVQFSSWILAAATSCYVLIALAPRLPLIWAAALVFGIGNGIYGAADWYLALRVLPPGRDTAKNLGIWHSCMVLPQIVGPLTTGYLISAAKNVASAHVAYALAFAVAAFWFILAAAFVGRVRLPQRQPA